MELGHVVRDEDEIGVVPRPCADPVPRVRRLTAICGVALDAEVRPPGPAAVTRRRGESLTCGVGPGQASQIAGDARRARHKETDEWTRRRGGRLLVTATSSAQDRE